MLTRMWVAQLKLGRLRFAHVRKESWMSGATLGVEMTGVAKAEGAVHRVVYVFGVRVFLTVVFPPADRA